MITLPLLLACSTPTTAEPAKPTPVAPMAPATDPVCGRYSNDPSKPLSLMKKRLTLPATANGEDIPRAYSVMGAPEPLERESRILDEKGEDKFVVFVKELFQTEPPDAKELLGYFERAHGLTADNATFGSVAAGDGLKIVAMKPKAPTADGPAVLTLASLIVFADTTMAAADFYISPEVNEKKHQCGDFALTLLQGAAAGTRSLDLAGGPKSFPIQGRTLTMDLPPGFATTLKDGPDFSVVHVEAVTTFGSYPGYVLLYVGGHPDFEPPQGPGTPIDTMGELNGNPSSWKGYRSDNGGKAQATIQAGDLFLQSIRYATRDPAFLDTLEPISNSVRLSP